MLNFSMCTASIAPATKWISTVAIFSTCLLLAGLTSAYAAGLDEDSTPTITRSDVERRINMAERLLDTEQYQEAIRNLNLTVKRYRHNADAWNLLGYAHRRSGNVDAANAAYSRALSIDRYHLGALEYQGALFIELGKLDEAKVNLRLMNDRCPVGCEEQQELEAAINAAM